MFYPWFYFIIEIKDLIKYSYTKSYKILKLTKSPIKIKQATIPLGDMSVLDERFLINADIF